MNSFSKRLYEFIKINFSLILCYTVVSVFLILMIFNYFQTTKLNKISRGFLSRNFQELHINNIDISNLENILKEALPKGGVVLKKEFLTGNVNADINKIYFKKGFNSPTLLSGRFLSEEESFSNENLAVVGKNLINNIKNKNNKNWILINDTYYEVIGICGEEYESKLDSTIFIPMKGKNKKNIEGTIIVDGVSNIENFIRKVEEKSQNKIILEKIEEKKIVQVSIDPKTGKTTEEVITMKDLDSNFLSLYVYIITFISALLCIISISIYWYDKNKKEIVVCNILGFYKKEILFRLVKKYFAIATLGSLIGILISILILNIL
ncbi:FtsX-like permease family protein [Clostridium baratii]|uniref:FtsX-like permease family protein n=1 Tax=Clostridium baratii TaxID=1561 RepID=UPI00291338B9|nr:FtsX-like permease family protein [Clostridium baratii]MDU4912872.1 FtsX-like permease family protein [Clostridium baratii]